MCVETMDMEQEPGSCSTTGKTEGSPEGGSTSSSETREDDGNLVALQDRGTMSKQEKCITCTAMPNVANDNAGLQTAGAHENSNLSEDLDYSEDLDDSKDVDESSEQGGGSLTLTEENVSSEDRSCETNDSSEGTSTGPFDQEGGQAVLTSTIDTQQRLDCWTMVDPVRNEASTVDKGEECEKNLKKNTELITEEREKIAKVRNSIHSDDTPCINSLKDNRPVSAKVIEVKGEFASDNGRKDGQGIEADAQARREGSCKATTASSQGLGTSPVAVEVARSKPDSVLSKARGVEMLGHSKPPKEMLLQSRSLKGTPNYPNSRMEMFKNSKSLKETRISEEILSTVSFSGIQKGINISSKTTNTVLTSDSQKEVDISHEDPHMVSDSGAQKVSSEISEAPSKGFNSETQKEGGSSPEDPRTVSRSESLKEGFMSPKATSEVSASEAEEESSVSSEVPILVPTSGALTVGMSLEDLSVVSNSVVPKDVMSSYSPSTVPTVEAQDEVNVSSEASSTVSNSVIPKDVDMSSDSPSMVLTPEAQEETSKSSETSNMVPNFEVQNEVGISADTPSRACEAEEGVSVSSAAPSTVSTCEAQTNFGIRPEEIIPRAEVASRVSAPSGLQRMESETGKEKARNPLQKPPQQSETTVSIREGLPRARSEEGKETSSVLEGDARESDYSLTSTPAFRYEEKLAQRDETIARLDKKALQMEGRSNYFRGKLKALELDYKDLCNDFEQLGRNHEALQRNHEDLNKAYREKETEYSCLSATAQSYAISYRRLKNSTTRENDEKEKMVRDLRDQLEQMKKECGDLQNQISLHEQQYANEQSRGGSYLDDTKAATPALLVSALNGVKDASNNFVKVLKSSIQPGIDTAQLEDRIGTVFRNGHIKFQYQAYICRLLFSDFDLPYEGSSKVVLPPMTCFRQYQNHDLKKTNTVERLLHYDREIDGSLHEFCFDKFLKLMVDIQEILTDRSIDLMQQVQNKQHPRGSKLYDSFCKLAVSVWLLQRLAFSFPHPAQPFIAERGEPFDLNRMQSVVPLDEPASDEEVQLRVGFNVLPGFDIGNSAIPCEVYVALK